MTSLHLPDAPAIVGLSFRPVRGEEDAAALYAVHTGRMARDAVDPLSTFESFPSLERLQASLAQALVEKRQDHWLVAQVGGRVVGYSQIKGWPEGDGTWVYLTLGWVLPEWRSRGLGTAMLHWAEDRIRRLAATEHPHDKIEFAANASSTEREATALLLHEGYRAGYTIVEMGLDISALVLAPALPAGIQVHPASPAHFPLIAACIRAAYQHEYDQGRFDEGFDPAAYVAELSGPRHDPALWQVAWDGGQVVGQVLVVVEQGVAEVIEVSVHPTWRRRGLARGLLVRALHGLRARGIDVIRVQTNPGFRTRAMDLYQSVGFRVLKEFPRYRKPFSV